MFKCHCLDENHIGSRYCKGTTTLQVWTAYQESDLTGFVSLSYSSEDCAEIDCLGVKKLIKVEKLGANCLLL
ncbi:TPA: GNAT family acetyltransferase [Streptococcus pneumoniae]|nr:GNAT family acetyltransferase [Streptococcus pneumoniae]HEV0997236.1 GNAT family acetyltransferase [Streptococcus pneumoniae]